jgi:3-hydroxyacyl-CoA dehydrogenase
MPLVEIVPGPETETDRVEFVTRYFETTPGPVPLPLTASEGQSPSQGNKTEGHYRPITLHKEVTGFVGNRLAFALLREACHLVGEGVVSARDLDAIVTASLGPRWAGSGVFESYHAGGGEGGIGAFLQKLAPTVQPVWRDLGQTEISPEGGEKWREIVVQQTEEAYGTYTPETRKGKEEMLREVVQMQQRRWTGLQQ